MIKAILFDLDGTLLSVDNDRLTERYFSLLTEKLCRNGYGQTSFAKAMWEGIGAMMKNSGSFTNEQVFWDTFSSALGKAPKEDIEVFEDFYENEFKEVKTVCGFDERAGATVRALKAQGFRLALATQPVFPFVATEQRAAWAGTPVSEFELVTSYESSRFCKPNTEYYLNIANALGVEPQECLMVGNDTVDDMSAALCGMKVFLLTDNLINRTGEDITKYPSGSFEELLRYIEEQK